ncbi:Prenylcysteine lyase [Kalmanozyma brasiliensis GHG001]|uniref:Prenylcysteine lyase domain-containing protein n=1 Tax=Kalmanozyma brasiliensis (strain GHG001) TaxID=1365824 RepID=V5EV18_KALBG|nr:Prenylcysteine lyase [Kalmanozyma brasiliensis GHG001]EST09280.1 Prenylcysteine lyase [Kalmanozyma brasiliensis GHG001]
MIRISLLAHLTLLLALVHAVVSHQHPFSAAQDATTTPRTQSDVPQPPLFPSRETADVRRIAIVGGGPSGTSAAYFLSTAASHLSSLNHTTTLSMTLFERSPILGGRAAITHPYTNTSYDPIELGASIFADVNYNLRRAVQDFKLDTGAHTGVGGETGIWDGQQFLFTGDQGSWWTSARFFLRYGYGAVTTQGLVARQLGWFSGLYRAPFLHSREREGEKERKETVSGYPWSTVGELAEAVNASSLVGQTGMAFLKDHRVGELFIEEMVEAATRVNYAQDTDAIHAFGAMVSLAASGATGVKTGNFRIFEEFAKRSGARILTGVEGEVTGLIRYPTANGTKWYVGSKSGEGELFDAVILATPWHNSGITLLNTPHRVKGVPFVHLHVTLLTTSRTSPRGSYFGMGENDAVPRTILTSSESVRRAKGDTSKKGPRLEFFSLTYLRSVTHPQDGGKEWVVKIFSPSAIPVSLLDSLFGDSISWVQRHEWDSYPQLHPTDRFPHIEIDDNLYYSNALESLVSTMETSTVAAKNSVALLMKKWFGDAFVNGKGCRYGVGDWGRDPMDGENWAGWGCDSG